MGRRVVLHEARKKVMAQTKGVYPAPLRILDVVGKGTYEAEAAGFGDLLLTPESAGLRHLFHAITHCKKDDVSAARPVTRVGMLGAGLMGAGVATVLADQGVPVRLKDRDHASITKALDYARKVYGKARKRKVYGPDGAIVTDITPISAPYVDHVRLTDFVLPANSYAIQPDDQGGAPWVAERHRIRVEKLQSIADASEPYLPNYGTDAVKKIIQ